MNIHLGVAKEKIPEAILALNLEPIMVKAMEEGMSFEKATRGALELRRFYALYKKYGDSTISPSKFMDEMWHYHILDTMNYGPDCETMFGQFLHHFPYLGLRGGSDKQEVDETFERTKQLYFREFGEEMLGGGSDTACVSPGPGGQCASCVSPSLGEVAKQAYCQPNCGLNASARPTLADYLAQSSAH